MPSKTFCCQVMPPCHHLRLLWLGHLIQLLRPPINHHRLIMHQNRQVVEIRHHQLQYQTTAIVIYRKMQSCRPSIYPSTGPTLRGMFLPVVADDHPVLNDVRDIDHFRVVVEILADPLQIILQVILQPIHLPTLRHVPCHLYPNYITNIIQNNITVQWNQQRRVPLMKSCA